MPRSSTQIADDELFRIGEKFGTDKFTRDRRWDLYALAGALSLYAGTLDHPDPRNSEAAKDSIAEALFQALQWGEDVDVSLLKEVVRSLFNAYGVDMYEIKRAFTYVVKNGAGKTDRGAIATVVDWVGADFFQPAQPSTT